MNIEDFHRLYDYNSWANNRTLDFCAPSLQTNSRVISAPVSNLCATRSSTFMAPNGFGSNAGTAAPRTAFPPPSISTRSIPFAVSFRNSIET